jgi:hypothetical protein
LECEPRSIDTPANHEMIGPGYFHWNAGGWFGSQAGGTAWLLAGAVVLTPRSPAVAVIWLACFALANVVGIWLWHCRTRVRPHTAIQLLLFMCGISGLLAWLTRDILRPEVVRLLDWPRHGYRMLLIVPALMAWSAIMEYASRGRSRSPENAEPGARAIRRTLDEV